MNDFGTKIKLLRKKMDLTQEQLAERLNVSSQAVSKWETGLAYPDIVMFPVLANFFDVTTDELLGVDLSKKKQNIKACLDEYDRLSNLGKEKEKFEYIKNAHKEYPNDFFIMEKYIWMLCYDPNSTDKPGLLVHEEELLYLCNRLLDECTDDKLRYSALSVLGGIYNAKGNIEKALEYANRFPDWYFTVGQEIENTYNRGEEKWWESVRKNIMELSEILMVKIRNCALHSTLPPDGKIKILQKAVSLIKMVYDERDYGFSHYHLAELFIMIAKQYIILKDYQSAAKYLDDGLAHAKIYDELPQVTTHTSFLIEGCRFDRANVYSGFEGNDVKREMDGLENNIFYNDVRGMDWFEAILDKYRPFSKNYKQVGK